MRIVVQKFGGSSLAPLDNQKEALQRVWETVEDGFTPIVVVSAMGRVGDPYATDTLLDLISQVNPEAEPRNTDLLLSCGEIISASIFAEGLRSLGLPALALTGWQCGIQTDDQHLSARVQQVHGKKLRAILEAGKIPVVAGFQGSNGQGVITTLGRGGSDTTAAVLAVSFKAERVEIYTDVDGIKTVDPKFVPDAPTIKILPYREVVELAHMGAQVLHPRAAEIVMEEGIPLQIRSVKDSQGGTLVVHGSSKPRGSFEAETIADRIVTGVVHLGKRAHVQIRGFEKLQSFGLSTKIFQVLAEVGVSVDLIYLSPDLIAFIIDQAKVQIAENALTPLDLNVKIRAGFAKVSVVGAGMHGVPGVMARVVSCLETKKITIFQTTDSHANISCLILEEHIPQAVQALYGEFNLDRI